MVNNKQIVGWLFLILGIAVIFYSLFSSLNIFTGKTMAPEIFSGANGSAANGTPIGSLNAQVDKMIGEQLKSIIPSNAIPKLLNLISWSIFATLLIFGGVQISNLGIKLLKS